MATVDEGSDPQRIEIELTPHQPAPGRRPPTGSDEGWVDVAADPQPGPLDTERGRLIAVGSFAAVVALVIGVLVGRMGAEDVATTGEVVDSAPVVTDGATPTTTRAGATDTLPRAPRVLSPPPTVVETTAPTDSEQMTTGQIDVDPAATIAAVEVVALTVRGDLVRVDAATGRTVRTSLSGSQFGPPMIYAGDGWILVPSFDEARGSTVVYDDGTRATIDAGTSWPLLLGAESGTFWRPDTPNVNGIPDRLIGFDIDGSETGESIELNGLYPQLADPLGGVVVQGPGGYYAVTPAGAMRLTSGYLIALGPRQAVVNECAETLECGYAVVDRETGERTPFTLDPSLGDQPSLDGGWWAFREPMSPDGDAVLVTYWDQSGTGRQFYGVIDLLTGGFQQIGDAIDTPLMEWSPDGRSVFWMNRGRLFVFNRSTGESVLFSEELGTINAFTVRPVLPSVDGPPPTSRPPDSTVAG